VIWKRIHNCIGRGKVYGGEWQSEEGISRERGTSKERKFIEEWRIFVEDLLAFGRKHSSYIRHAGGVQISPDIAGAWGQIHSIRSRVIYRQHTIQYKVLCQCFICFRQQHLNAIVSETSNDFVYICQL
jgi:hypothetical protein